MNGSDALWYGPLSDGWIAGRLKSRSVVVNGSTPRSGEASYWSGDIVWTTPEDLGKLTGKVITASGRTLSREGLASCGASLVPAGSLVVSTRAPIGHIAIAGVVLCTNQGCRSLVLRGDDDSRFYYYLLAACRSVLESRGRGSTFTELSSSDFGDVPVPLPPLTTQKAIADFLDRKTAAIDALIEKKQKLLDLLAEKRSALINQAVTRGLDPNVPMKDSGIPWIGEIPAHWETPQLGHCLARITYGFTCPMPTTDAGPYMLTANDIRDGFVDYENARRTDAGAAAKLTEKCLPKAGDVLLTKDGTLGRVAVADGSNACINQSVALLRTNGRLSFSFLSWMLRSSSYQDWMVFDAGGTTIKHIYITRVVKMTALIPPVSEQSAIVRDVGRLDEVCRRTLRGMAASIARLQEYRQALITAAVTGQLGVPVTNDVELPP